MKECNRCKAELPLDNFQERAPGYLYRQCRKCRLEVRHERYKNYPDSKIKDLERSKLWYEKNKDVVAKKRKERRDPKRDKWYRLKYNFKLDRKEYEKILEDQGGVCAICTLDKRLYVDHDHNCCPTEFTCGKCVRGLICQKCNMMMHYVDEYSEYLEKGREYAKRHRDLR